MKTFREIFEERVRPRIIVRNNCWLTNLTDNGKGYVYVHVRPRRYAIHRLAYRAFIGPIPKGLYILHGCDNRGCCNPAHLRAGTQGDNIHDMDQRGRRRNWHPEGLRNPSAKLVPDQVIAIRLSKARNRDLARMFGVSPTMIGYIKTGKAWKSLSAEAA